MRLLALTTAAMLLAVPLLRADDRRAPPDADAQANAEKTIRDLFKEDFAKRKTADAQALAVKLLQQAADTKNDPAAEFVLLRLAQELAAKAGDAATALQAIDAQARDFAVDATDLKARALDAAVRAPVARVDYQAILDAALPAADDARAADDYDAAARLLHAGQIAAQKIGNKQLATVAFERGKLVEGMQKEHDNVKADLETLKTKPEDSDACLHVGRFLCFFKGDWDKGLPLLALGSDAKLKDLAKKDLNGPTAPEDQAALADAWMAVADAEPAAQPLIQLHAYGWYKQADVLLAGLDKAKVDKKIKDLDKLAQSLTAADEKGASADAGWFVLMRSPDPRIWDTDANLGKNAFAVPLRKAPDGVQFLMLTLVSTKDFVIIPMTHDALKKRSDDGTVGWQGEASLDCKGYHLGIYLLPLREPQNGEITVYHKAPHNDGLGWGFGHRAYLNDVQGYSWAGVPIAPTVFEIAVKAGPLTDLEAKHLLGKKDK